MSNRSMKIRKWRNPLLWMNMVIIFLIPLIVFVKKVPVLSEYQGLFGNVSEIIDFFAYYKMKLIHVGAIVSLIPTLYFKIKEGWKFKWDLYSILLVLFSITIIISFALSENKYIALFGYYDRFEGTLTWLAYICLSYSIYLYVEEEKDVISLAKSLVFSIGIVSLIGTLQLFNLDIFQSSFGKMIILGSQYQEYADQLVFAFDKGVAYSTLYNSNNVGTIVAVVLPLIFYLIQKTNVKRDRIIYVCIIVLSCSMLVGSKSVGGFIALLSIGIIMLARRIILNKTHRNKILISLITLTVAVLIVFIGPFTNQLQKLTSLVDIFEPTKEYISEVTVDGGNITVTDLKGDTVTVIHDNTSISIYNELDEPYTIEVDVNGNLIKPNNNDPWLVNFNSSTSELRISYWIIEEERYLNLFTTIVEGGYTFNGTLLDIESVGVDKYVVLPNESSLTKRGYIWNRGIPLFFDKPIFGHGADTFAILFPQDDIVGKFNINHKQSRIVDKPHSFYLDILIYFGLAGAIALIILIIYSLRNKGSFLLKISLIAYLITGIVYDSTIYTTYIFFILIAFLNSFTKIGRELN